MDLLVVLYFQKTIVLFRTCELFQFFIVDVSFVILFYLYSFDILLSYFLI